MNMRVNNMDFMNPQMTVVTAGDLGIPPSPTAAKDGQLYDIREADQYLIFSAGKASCGEFVVVGWHDWMDGRKKIELQNIRANTSLYLDNWQIGYLERNGLIRPLVAMGGVSGRLGNLPGSATCLTDRQREKGTRYLAYLAAANEECMIFNEGRSSRKLIVRALRRLAQERGEKPPAVSVIYEKLKASRQHLRFDPVVALAPKVWSGNRERHYCERTELAIRTAVEDAWRDPKGSWWSVYERLKKLTAEGGEFSDLANLVRDIGDQKRMVSDRTLQRRYREVDFYTRDQLRFGEEYAARVHARYIRQNRPERPLDIVDVDHTTLGIVVYDDVRGIGYGRPDLVLFRDRHSGIVLGWAISFGPPSYETFLDGLLHSMLPKGAEDLPPGVEYPWYGRAVALGVDNASHLVGMPIREAATELGFQLAPYRPGRPWEKGALEHLFHILNFQLIDRLPGATTMSPAERKKFDKERLKAQPEISLSELNAFLALHFATRYHTTSHEGLGELFTLHGVPAELWEQGIKNAPHRPVTSRDILVRLAGDSAMVTVQGDGVRWDYLVYQDAALAQLTLNPDHKSGTRQHGATEYKAVRDPSDLGRIWVQNPYNGQMIEVPICAAQASYAKGLKLYQHRKIVEHNAAQKRRADDAAALNQSMTELENQLLEVHAKRRKHGTAAQLARFISGQTQRLQRTQAIQVGTSGGGRMDYAAPLKPEMPDSTRPALPESEPTEDAAQPTPMQTLAADIDAIRAKYNWED